MEKLFPVLLFGPSTCEASLRAQVRNTEPRLLIREADCESPWKGKKRMREKGKIEARTFVATYPRPFLLLSLFCSERCIGRAGGCCTEKICGCPCSYPFPSLKATEGQEPAQKESKVR